MKTKTWIPIAIVAVFVSFIIVVAFLGERKPPQPVALVASPEPQNGGHSQCIGSLCFTAPPNMDCILVGDGCETRIMGLAGESYDPEKRSEKTDFAVFVVHKSGYEILKLNSLLESVGLNAGDSVTEVNGKSPSNQVEFAGWVIKMEKGMVLSGFKKDGQKFTVKL